MIYLNCNQLPSTRDLTSNVNCVIFQNVKTEYRGDEDIIIEYILDPETEASSRNWIGMYPKGASQLDQYITFEWTILNPNNEPLQHKKITFYAKYHMNNIEPNTEYFFIFVNKHMKVIGSSSYFNFLLYHTLEIEDLKVPEKIRTHASSTPESLKSFSDDNLKMVLTDVDKEILHEIHYQADHSKQKKQIQLSSTHISESNCQNISGFKADVTLTSPDFPVTVNSHLSNNNHCCALCKRPANFAEIEQRLNAKIKMYAEYGHTLEKRIEELEKNFEMSQVAQKQLKLIAYHAKREKMSYQKFVNEMLSVLTNKGAVRILDGQGTELLLKRVDNASTENKESSLMYRTSQREEILKSVISSQENTIRELTEKLDHHSSAKKRENFLEVAGELSELSDMNPNLKQRHKALGSNAALTKFSKISSTEKNEANQKQNDIIDDSINESHENNSVNHTLNETYSIDHLDGEPVSVILPPDEFRPNKQLQSFEENGSNLINLNNDGQGDFHYKRTSAKGNIHELKQNVMTELRNAIRKRKDKGENFNGDQAENVSNESFNLSINETIQSTKIDESNALIIKGEHLQYAIIRIQQTP